MAACRGDSSSLDTAEQNYLAKLRAVLAFSSIPQSVRTEVENELNVLLSQPRETGLAAVLAESGR